MDKNKYIGRKIFQLLEQLFPITRSITGNGVRESLRIIKKIIPSLNFVEVPSGTKVFDWEIPDEWNIHDAYIKDPQGNRIIDFQESNLHVVGYSEPVHKTMSLEQLHNHIHTLPKFPDRIPYITNYYNSGWGFCMTHNKFKDLEKGSYEVKIDSTLKNGSLTYGEFYHKGKTDKEFLLTCYICHPSMANDSISGVALLTYLAKELKERETYYSYRILFIPETIGSITWLAKNEPNVKNIKYGLVATCLGDAGPFTYKRSRSGDAEIDRTAEYVLDKFTEKYQVEDFFPWGSDERQFCSPGFDLPVGSLMRTRYQNFDEYHTSADNLDFVKPKSLNESYDLYLKIIEHVELNFKYFNLNPQCEPNLGKRGLFKRSRTYSEHPDIQKAYFWILNFSDGEHSLLDIARKSDIDFDTIEKAAENLREAGLLQVPER